MKKILVLLILSMNLLGNISNTYNEAMKKYKNGEIYKAIELLQDEGIVDMVEGVEVEGINDKKLASYINDYAFFLMKVERYDDAEKALLRVLDLDNQRAVAYYNLSEIADIKEEKHMARQYALMYAYLTNSGKYVVQKDINDPLKGIKLEGKIPKLLEKYLDIEDFNNLRLQMVSSYEVEKNSDYDYVAFVVTKGKKTMTYYYEESGNKDFWWFLFNMNNIDLFKSLKEYGYEFWHGDRSFELEAKEYDLSYSVKNFIEDLKRNPIEDIEFLIKSDDIMYLEYEVENMVDKYLVDEKGFDILDYAYKYGSKEVIEIIEKKYKKEDFLTLVKKNEVEKIKEYIERKKDDKDFKETLLVRDKSGRTAYHLITEYNRVEIAQIYLDYINMKDLIDQQKLLDYYGKSPIYTASENGSFEVLKIILEKAKLDLASVANLNNHNEGKNALNIAIEKGNFHIVKFFVENGVDIEIRNTNGETALLTAARFSNDEIIRYLMENNADTGVIDNNGKGIDYYKVKVVDGEKGEEFGKILDEARKIYEQFGNAKSLEYIDSFNIKKILDDSFDKYNKEVAEEYIRYGKYLVEGNRKSEGVKIFDLAEEISVYDKNIYMELAKIYDEIGDKKRARRSIKKYLLLREDRGRYGSWDYDMLDLVNEDLAKKYLNEEERLTFISGNIDFYNLNNNEDYELVKLIIDYDLHESHFVIVLNEGGVDLEDFVNAFNNEELREYYKKSKKK